VNETAMAPKDLLNQRIPREATGTENAKTSKTAVAQSSESPASKPRTEAHKKPAGQRQAIDAFISKVQELGRKITRKDIWTAAGYIDRTEFERFQRGDRRTTNSAATAFNRVLDTNPEEFIRSLDKKRAGM
jgi:hypothetical protein